MIIVLIYIIQNTFDINLKDSRVEKAIDRQMQRAWRGYKYKLHAHFKEIRGEQDITKAKNQYPEDLSKDDWNFLCDRWTDLDFMASISIEKLFLC